MGDAIPSTETLQPIIWAPPLSAARPRIDCGSSRTADEKRCGQACLFIGPDYPQPPHGETRDEAAAGSPPKP